MAQRSKEPKANPTQYSEIAQTLFKQIISQQKIKDYTSIPANQLKIICKEAGNLFFKKILKKPNQILAFLSNYHQIIMGYNEKIVNEILNNISLHFILLSSYAMIQNGQKYAAKEMLKKALNYLGSTDPDPILLTTALNNLCILRMQDGKYYKSVTILTQMTQIMEDHMRKLKHSKRKGQAMEDSVFLVHSYYLLTKCLSKIVQKNHKTFYKDLYHYSSRIGLKKAIKYLGRESFLTQQFFKIADEGDLQLPIFVQQMTQRSTYEERLMKQLIKIQQLINRPQQPVIIKQVIKQAPPPPPPPPPIAIKDEHDLVCKCSRIINGWNVQIQIFKQKTQKLGNVVFNCRKDQQYVNLIINEQRMLKLLTQMNINDILPDQCSLNNLAPREFIQYCIFPFFFIGDNRNIQIFPRAHSFIKPFFFTTFGKQSIVFLYHIRHNEFRLAFGQKGFSETYYLQLELQPQFVNQIFEIKNQISLKMYKVYENLMKAEERQNNFKNNGEAKQITVKKQNMIIREMQSILKKFQTFVQNHLSDATLDDIFRQSNQFFKYCQNKNLEQGKFYYIRFLSNIRGFDIYIENTFETYKPDGKSKAKGNALYNSFQFFRDFGLPSQNGVLKFRCFCQILCKKYDLKSFQAPLSTKDLETYQQNSISEVKLTSKTYLRKMRPYKHNILPITACLVSINNQIPVGIKLSGYNFVTCIQYGYFIFIPHQSWLWPEKQQQQVYDPINGVVEQYGYKKNYYLVNWLQRFGFRRIIELLKIDNEDNFYIEGVHSNFFRIENVIDIMI